MNKRERLTPRPSCKKNNKSVSPQNGKLKQKLKQNQATHRKSGKQNQTENSKQEHSLKVCIDLANYHRKEAQNLNAKNEELQHKLKMQLQDMENLKKQLSEIKISLQNNHLSKKQSEGLKTQNCRVNNENQCLRNKIRILETKVEQLNSLNKILEEKVQELTTQDNLQKPKGSEIQSVLMVEAESKYDYDMNILSLAKESRRQEYAHNYENYTFVPSATCFSCKKKEQQLEEARQKYCNQLRQLQEQVNYLQRSQLAIEVMEKQMIAKNECIDFLLHQLTIFQSESKGILQNMVLLESRFQQVNIETSSPRCYNTDRLCHSFSKTIA